MKFLQTTLKTLAAAALLGAMAAGVNAATSIEERLKPVGDICMAGEPCASATLAAAGAGEPRGGEQVYNSGCAACHTSGAAGAPKIGDNAAWTQRMEKGRETLYEHAYSGFNAMPAKGLCADCTREEVDASVDFMLSESGI